MKRLIAGLIIILSSIVAFMLSISSHSLAGKNQFINPGQEIESVSAVAIDPEDTNTVYIGTQRGVFKSTNSGSDWIPINKGLKNKDVLTLSIDPVVTRTLYAGTRCGAFKSTDGDRNWIVSK